MFDPLAMWRKRKLTSHFALSAAVGLR